MRILLRRALASTLLLASGLCGTGVQAQSSPEAMRAAIEDLARLTNPPASQIAPGSSPADNPRAIFFDGPRWRGKPTKVFAWLGMPGHPAGKVPGIVLVHGGGGTAFKDWVSLWNARGYAAISIAVEGQTDEKVPVVSKGPRSNGTSWKRHEFAGPARSGIYGDSAAPIADQWIYHAVADTILADSLLRSLPEVDPSKVGLMGISWGGVIASTAIGLDGRFAFAIPAYGCGGLHRASNGYGLALGTNACYQQAWDPNLRLDRARMPVLWLSWPGDGHFPMDALSISRQKVSGPSAVSLVPGMSHGHNSAWKRPESYAFADSVLKEGGPWCLCTGTHLQGGILLADFNAKQRPDKSVLVSTSGTGFTGSRVWVQTPATLKEGKGGWTASATIPPGTTACFLNVMRGDLVSSSGYLEMEPPSVR